MSLQNKFLKTITIKEIILNYDDVVRKLPNRSFDDIKLLMRMILGPPPGGGGG